MGFACILTCTWWYINNKSFGLQLTNKAPYFESNIILLTKSLFSNIEAAGDPASRV